MPQPYTYDDCHARNREHPDTFQIPTAGELAGLITGDHVKLVFQVENPVCGVDSERMWVRLQKIERNDDGTHTYTGVLDNDPALMDLTCGDPVHTFSERHIADYHYNRAARVEDLQK